MMMWMIWISRTVSGDSNSFDHRARPKIHAPSIGANDDLVRWVRGRLEEPAHRHLKRIADLAQ
jgi:hypothetical protein